MKECWHQHDNENKEEAIDTVKNRKKREKILAEIEREITQRRAKHLPEEEELPTTTGWHAAVHK